MKKYEKTFHSLRRPATPAEKKPVVTKLGHPTGEGGRNVKHFKRRPATPAEKKPVVTKLGHPTGKYTA